MDTAACNGWRKGHSSRLALLIVALLVATNCAAQWRDVVDEGRRDPGLMLNAAPQDRALFLSWNATPEATYIVRSRPTGTSAWSVTSVGSTASYTLQGLTNGVEYEVELQASAAKSWKRRSMITRATPRVRLNCAAIRYIDFDPRMNFFCSWTELDAFLERERVDPARLRCRNQPIGAWSEHVPDCLYELPSGRLALLLRSADERFAKPCGYRDPREVARIARRLLWPANDPFESTERLPLLPIASFAGHVTRHLSVQTYRIDTAPDLASRVTWLTPRDPAPNRYAIYHEGHGLAGIDGAAETIDWLLARGWTVIAIDMPLTGANAVDARPGLEFHFDFDTLDDGGISPLALYLTPVKAVVDEIIARSGTADPDVLMIGRSGGGWTTYLYATIDPRIDVAVPIAGGTPMSQRLIFGPAEVGDYEQFWPQLFSVVRHEDLMIAAGSRGSLHVYNELDPCCYKVRESDAFVPYLRNAGEVFDKKIEVFVDKENRDHSIGVAAYVKLDAFLREAFGVRRPLPPLWHRRIPTCESGSCGCRTPNVQPASTPAPRLFFSIFAR